MSLLKTLQDVVQRTTHQSSFVIAYSGGLDSHALLHAMAALHDHDPNIKIKAVHVNHQISTQSDNWAMHCQKTCDDLKVDLSIETIALNLKPGDSLEDKARLARYTCLEKYTNAETVILTAHHQNDQAETFLLQALRGSGLKGLSAMPEKKVFGASCLVRPLLSVSREDLKKYALANQLQWIEDDSNIDTRFDRNFLRHEILPKLVKRYPAAFNNLSRTARLCADSEAMVADAIAVDWKKVKTNRVDRLQLAPLLKTSNVQQRLLLRHWFSENNLQMPSEKQLVQIQRDVLCASSDANPCFCLGDDEIRRYANQLYLIKKQMPIDLNWQAKWDMKAPLALPGDLGMLETFLHKSSSLCKREAGRDFKISFLKNPPGSCAVLPTPFDKGGDQRLALVTVRFRRGGEIIKLSDNSKTRTLKNLFQEWGVPPWERDRVPLIFHQDTCIAVVGFCVSDEIKVWI